MHNPPTRIALCASLAVLVSAPLLGQGPPPVWTRDSIRSEILGETRQLRISLPFGYNGPTHVSERYPVLIVLDAQNEIMSTATMVNAKSLGLPGDPAIPPLLIVGVETDKRRYHDMTPIMPGGATGPYEGAGGAPAFLKFLSTELAPHIAQRYRTLPVTVLAGHSMSGLFAAWAYGHAPEFLMGSIALSPSLQESGVFTAAAFAGIASRSRPGRLFVANGPDESIPLDSAVQTFSANVRTKTSMGARFAYDRIPDASHNHTMVLGMMPGLRFVFAPVSLARNPIVRLARRIPPAQMVDTFENVRTAYARGARELGMPDTLPSSFLSTVAVHHRAPANAPVLLRICQELSTAYPRLWGGYACAADAQVFLGDTAGAVANYTRAVENARRMRDSTAMNDISDKLGRIKQRRPPGS